MIRNIAVFALFLFGAFFSGLYFAYDEIDPCRALAVEKARRSPLPTTIAEVLENITGESGNRLVCTRSLVDSWRQRLED